MKHSKRSPSNGTVKPPKTFTIEARGETKEEALSCIISDCITAMEMEPVDSLVALMPMTAHAALFSEFSKQQFLDTAALAFDAIKERFGADVVVDHG